MRFEQLHALAQRLLTLRGQGCVTTHLAHRHARETQSIEKEQPADVLLGVDAPAAGVARDAGHEALLLVPANRVHAAARLARGTADVSASVHAQGEDSSGAGTSSE